MNIPEELERWNIPDPSLPPPPEQEEPDKELAALLHGAALDALGAQALAGLPDAPPPHTFSAGFESAMRDTIRAERRRGLRVLTGGLRRAGTLLVACMTCLFFVVHVGAWSQRFFDRVERIYPDHTEITFQKDGANIRWEDRPAFIPYEMGWIPNDLRRTSNHESGHMLAAGFDNGGERRLYFDQYFADTVTMGVDTEDAQVETIDLGGYEARLISKQNAVTVIWNDDTYCYSVLSFGLGRADTLRVAQSVRIKGTPYPTAQQLPVESLPADYPPETARRYGDILLFEDGSPAEGLDRLEAFVAACERGTDGAVRLITYQKNGSYRAQDLELQDGLLYYTQNNRFDPDSDQPFIMGERYDRLGMLDGGGKRSVLAYSSSNDQPAALAVYPFPTT